MARARATRWRWPPESCAGLRPSSSPSPRVSAARFTLVARSSLSTPRWRSGNSMFFADRQVRVERVALEHHGHVAVLGVDVVDDAVADGDRAVTELLEPGHEAQRRRLAAARGAEQDEELAVGDRQGEVVDRGGLAEALGDPLEADLCQRAPSGRPPFAPPSRSTVRTVAGRGAVGPDPCSAKEPRPVGRPAGLQPDGLSWPGSSSPCPRRSPCRWGTGRSAPGCAPGPTPCRRAPAPRSGSPCPRPRSGPSRRSSPPLGV